MIRWIEDLFCPEPATFNDALELLIARWTDRSRKGRDAMTIKEIGNALLDKAEAILDKP